MVNSADKKQSNDKTLYLQGERVLSTNVLCFFPSFRNVDVGGGTV